MVGHAATLIFLSSRVLSKAEGRRPYEGMSGSTCWESIPLAEEDWPNRFGRRGVMAKPPWRRASATPSASPRCRRREDP